MFLKLDIFKYRWVKKTIYIIAINVRFTACLFITA